MILLTATWRLPILTSAIHQPTGLAGDNYKARSEIYKEDTIRNRCKAIGLVLYDLI